MSSSCQGLSSTSGKSLETRLHPGDKFIISYYIIIIGDGSQIAKVHILFSHSSLGLFSDRLHQVLRLLVLFTSPRLFNKYKTFSVLIYSNINTSGIGKTRNCMGKREIVRGRPPLPPPPPSRKIDEFSEILT